MKKLSLLSHPIAAFAGKFLALYLLLAIPWPFITQSYRDLGKNVGQALFNSQNSSREISFDMGKNPQRPFDARITIVNPAILQPDGSGPVRNLDFDTRGVCWSPFALLIALVVASPVSWKRRWQALAISLPLLFILNLGLLNFCIWDESSEINLVTLTPFWKEVASTLRLLIPACFSLAAPLTFWLVSTLRQQDFVHLRNELLGIKRDSLKRSRAQ